MIPLFFNVWNLEGKEVSIIDYASANTASLICDNPPKQYEWRTNILSSVTWFVFREQTYIHVKMTEAAVTLSFFN